MSEGGEDTAPEEEARPEQAAASPPPERKSADERKHSLSRTIANLSAGGWRVESQGDYRAVVAKKEMLTFERKQIVEVDEWGHVSIQDMGRQFSW